MIFRRVAIFSAIFIFLIPFSVSAHQPVLEPARHRYPITPDANQAISMQDPTEASVAIYGRLEFPGEVDTYRFVVKNEAEVPFNLLVPVWAGDRHSLSLVLIGKDIPSQEVAALDFFTEDVRKLFYEPFSQEMLYEGRVNKVKLKPGEYYLRVSDGLNQTGPYVIGAGTVENFENANFGQLIKTVGAMKLGLYGEKQIPWMDFFGIFLMLAGFGVGLGAVTVIDWHGFLARKSAYWTEATTRAHKVTKPLIWLGFGFLLAGGIVLYRDSLLSHVALFQAIIFIVMLLNGIFLSFRVSPFLLRREKEGRSSELLPRAWQAKIAVSFVISFLSWWTQVFLFAWYLVVIR